MIYAYYIRNSNKKGRARSLTDNVKIPYFLQNVGSVQPWVFRSANDGRTIVMRRWNEQKGTLRDIPSIQILQTKTKKYTNFAC